MASDSITELAKKLKPFIIGWINEGTPAGGVGSYSSGEISADHGSLFGLADDDHTQYLLSGSSAGSGLEDGSREIYLGTPSTLHQDTTNAVTATSHTHVVSTSSDPGASASILASNSSGYLKLVRVGLGGVNPSYPLHVSGSSYLIGNTGVGVVPTQKFHVSGSSYLDGHTGISTSPHATYSLDVSGSTRITGYTGINADPNASYNLRVSGDTYIHDGEIGLGAVPSASARLWIDGSGGLTYSVYTDSGVARLGNETRIAYTDAIYTSLVTDSNGNITIAPTGTNIEVDGVALGTDHFVSQLTGWEVDYDGNADFRYIYADEMHVKAFIADIYEALVGAIVVTKSRAKLSQDFTVPFGAQVTGIDGDISSASIGIANVSSDYFTIAGDETANINPDDKFAVFGSTGNNGVWTVASDSYSSGSTLIYTEEEISSSIADGNITFLNYFSIDGDHTSDGSISASDILYVNNSTDNDGMYAACSISYDAIDDETDIYPTAASIISGSTADGSIGKRGTLYIQDLEGYEGLAVFEDDDFVLLRVIDTSASGNGLIVTNAWGIVNTHTDLGDGEQSWNFDAVRTSTAFAASAIMYAGALALDYGQSGDGVWEATVLDTNSPYSQITTWDTDPWTPGNFTLHTREGNLDGISGIGLEYGLWAGQGTTASDAYVIMSSCSAEIHNLEVRVQDSTNDRIVLSPSAPYLSVGTVAPTGYLSQDGFWVGSDGGAYKFHLGDVNGEVLAWSGANLYIYSNLSNGDFFRAGGSSLEMYANNQRNVELTSSGSLTLGYTDGGEYVEISSCGIKMYGGGTQHVGIVSSGSLWVGSASSTERMSWDTTNGLQIYNHSNSAVLKFPTSGNAQIIGTLALTNPGVITAGGGDVEIGYNGIAIASGDDPWNYIQWNGTYGYARINYLDTTGDFTIEVDNDNDGYDSTLYLGALANASDESKVILDFSTVGNYARATYHNNAGTDTYSLEFGATNILQINSSRIHTPGYLTTSGGIHVGGTSDPGADDLLVDGDATVGGDVLLGGELNIGTAGSELSISSGVLTLNGTSMVVDVGAETGTDDDLDTINGGTGGDIIILRAHAGDTITVTENGNIRGPGTSTDLSYYNLMTLWYSGSTWYVIAIAND